MLSIASAAQAAPHWLSPVTAYTAGSYVDGTSVGMNSAGTTVYLYRMGSSQMWAVVRPAGGSFGTPQQLTAVSSPAYATGYDTVTVGRDGSFIAIWEVNDSSNHGVLQTATLAPGSTTFGSPTTLETTDGTTTGNYYEPPYAATDANGDSVAVWSLSDFTTGNVVVHAFLRPAGGSWSGPMQISDNSASKVYNAIHPQVVIDDAGDITAAWVHAVAGGVWGLDTVYRSASPSFGSGSWGTVQNLVASGGSLRVQNEIKLADNASGKVALGYVVNDGSTTLPHVLTASSGGGTYSDQVVSGATQTSVQGVATALDPAGDVLAAYWVNNVSPTQVWAAERTASSSTFESPQQLNAGANSATIPIQLALDDNGNAFAAWDGTDTGTCPSTCVQAATRPAGGSWSAYQDISANGSFQAGYGTTAQPLSTDANGDALVGWSGPSYTLGVTPYSTGPVLSNVQIPASGTAGTAVSFSASASDTWSTITSMHWVFGDGTSADGANVSHTYGAAGNFNVTITATDADSNSAQAAGPIAIAAATGGGGSGTTGGTSGGGTSGGGTGASGGGGGTPPAGGGGPPAPTGKVAASCTLSSTGAVQIPRPKKKGRSKAKSAPRTGTLPVQVRCDQSARVRLQAVLTDVTKTKSKGRTKTKTKRYNLAVVNANVAAGSTRTLKLKLPASVVSDLLRHAKQSVSLTLLATNANGTSRTTSKISSLKT